MWVNIKDYTDRQLVKKITLKIQLLKMRRIKMAHQKIFNSKGGTEEQIENKQQNGTCKSNWVNNHIK